MRPMLHMGMAFPAARATFSGSFVIRHYFSVKEGKTNILVKISLLSR